MKNKKLESEQEISQRILEKIGKLLSEEITELPNHVNSMNVAFNVCVNLLSGILYEIMLAGKESNVTEEQIMSKTFEFLTSNIQRRIKRKGK